MEIRSVRAKSSRGGISIPEFIPFPDVPQQFFPKQCVHAAWVLTVGVKAGA